MRILLINPLGVNVYDELVDEVVRPALSSDTELVVRSLAGTGVPETAFLPAASLLLNQLLSAVQQGERDGFDAVVIACASDPGLADAKELVSIPVTAPMEAAIATGRALGRGCGRVGVAGPRRHRAVLRLHDLVRAAGPGPGSCARARAGPTHHTGPLRRDAGRRRTEVLTS